MVQYIDEDIKEVMDITGLDKVKAEKLFKSVAKDLDDGTDDELCSYDIIDAIALGQKAKENGTEKMYATSEKPKAEKKPRVRKVDSEKAEILEYIKKGLTLAIDSTTIITENEVKLHFNYNGSAYSVTLTRHKPPKK